MGRIAIDSPGAGNVVAGAGVDDVVAAAFVDDFGARGEEVDATMAVFEGESIVALLVVRERFCEPITLPLACTWSLSSSSPSSPSSLSSSSSCSSCSSPSSPMLSVNLVEIDAHCEHSVALPVAQLLRREDISEEADECTKAESLGLTLAVKATPAPPILAIAPVLMCLKARDALPLAVNICTP